MISFAKEKDREEIVCLWNKVFGDSKKDIDSFLNRYFEYVLVYKIEEKTVGILTMLPVFADGKKGRYIYAVATDKEFRGLGISTKLLEYANDYIKKNGECFSVLVPAEKSLFDFYQKRGYTRLEGVKRIVDIKPNVVSGFAVKRISASEYHILRKDFLSDRRVIEWDVAEIEYISECYDKNLFYISGEGKRAICICNFYDDIADIKELLVLGFEIEECIGILADKFKFHTCTVTCPGECEDAIAMVYPDEYKYCYFNLAMD